MKFSKGMKIFADGNFLVAWLDSRLMVSLAWCRVMSLVLLIPMERRTVEGNGSGWPRRMVFSMVLIVAPGNEQICMCVVSEGVLVISLRLESPMMTVLHVVCGMLTFLSLMT